MPEDSDNRIINEKPASRTRFLIEFLKWGGGGRGFGKSILS
jgi:hypothetical protein